MKNPIKVHEYWRNKPRNIYIGVTRFQRFKRFMKGLLLKGVVAAIVLGIYTIGTWNSETVIAFQEKIVYAETPYPVLERIAQCESHTSHYDKNGQVLINTTRDVGVFQINVPIWGKKATEMGLNLMEEKDNREFALWLYKNYGTIPWIHSQKCWNK